MKKKKIEDLEWFVYRYNVNKNEIEQFNIFNHWKFCEDLEKARKKYKTREEFEEKLKSELKYYFWSRAEYELIIEITEEGYTYLYPWCGCRNPEEVKRDVSHEGFLGLEFIVWYDFANEHISKQRYGHQAKIDIFDQVNYVWDMFCIYVCEELGVE